MSLEHNHSGEWETQREKRPGIARSDLAVAMIICLVCRHRASPCGVIRRVRTFSKTDMSQNEAPQATNQTACALHMTSPRPSSPHLHNLPQREVHTPHCTRWFGLTPSAPGMLTSLTHQGPLGLTVARYSAEILDALAYLHSLDFLHRDLCLTNVFLTPLYHCQLADYNLATRSTGGTARPTPQYSAPEILSGNGEYGPLADVYSFGVIVLFMFGGTHSISDKDVAHFRTHFFLDVHLPSPNIEPLLQSTMAQDPNDRHSADELRSAAFFEDVSWSKQREACWNDHAQTYQTSPMSSVA